jgi:hypothetical protein
MILSLIAIDQDAIAGGTLSVFSHDFLMEAVAWRPIFTLVAYDRKGIRTRRFCRLPVATTNHVRP